MAPQPLHAVLGDEVAALFADLHRAHGVDLRTGVTLGAIRSHRRPAASRSTSTATS